MRSVLLAAATAGVLCGPMALVSAQNGTAQTDARFKIVVIAGEGAVNIIQKKTAVSPIVEVRDRNNLPVSGVAVTFSVSGPGATFGGGAHALTVATNALGQATATGLTPTAAGAIQLNATAAIQGQTMTVTIAQTNFVTAAQAAAAGGGGSGAGGGAGAAAAAGGGGFPVLTVGIIGAAVGGGVVAAEKTGLIGGDGTGDVISISGVVFARASFGQGGSTAFSDPVSGAVVSTSLDAATTTTDSAGRFLLHTTTPKQKGDGCRVFTVTIMAAGLPTYSVTGSHGTGGGQGDQLYRQQFSLSPTIPDFVGVCQGP